MEFDLHLHTIASGHATRCTITDMSKKAAERSLKLIGISDHGPASNVSARPSYFQSLANAPRRRCDIEVLYGAELNILDFEGNVDLSDDILSRLDYAIISMHLPIFRPGTVNQNTLAYIKAMDHPRVRFIGHPDDSRFPVDYEELIKAAAAKNVLLEINNNSLSPDGYRGNSKPNLIQILELCLKYQSPLLLSSDSHGNDHIGDFQYALTLIHEIGFPEHLILNRSVSQLKCLLK